MKKNLGFTLAETLIVIAIIGIIASIVTPMLFGTTSDAELKSKWKKIYGDLSQATQLVMHNNGGSISGAFTDGNSFRNAYSNHFNIIKFCKISDAEGCWKPHGEWYFLNGTTGAINDTNRPGLIINNGSFIVFYFVSNTCNNSTSSCGAIIIDVNGSKKPNMVGKDIFYTRLFNNVLTPYGSDREDSMHLCDTDHFGHNCSAQYLYD
ncbi:MAG: prepilin-type N-terminal cleavage/methylation domain-containing protein [Candidatus Gastranaerophilales bacterium]|nr:prepilin-type N-terminal cleavage/methylation domain-containing protein [Candidatus Gastranaerophilales bacterium]